MTSECVGSTVGVLDGGLGGGRPTIFFSNIHTSNFISSILENCDILPGRVALTSFFLPFLFSGSKIWKEIA